MAYLAGDSRAYVESVGVAARQLEGELDALQAKGQTMPPDEAASLKMRLNAMCSGLSEPITSQHSERAREVEIALEHAISRL